MNLIENKERIFSQVAQAMETANRTDQVNVIAVTKYVGIDQAKALVDTGVRHIGENRVDKFLEKYQALKDAGLTWHLIGSLQRRKVKEVINYVDYFHALDSMKLAQEIQKRASHPIKCFIQVNISGEESKHGFAPEELDALLPEIENLDNLQIVGLMTMAPFEASQDELQAIFAATHQLQKELQQTQLKNMSFTELSLGMSRDYDLAIANGATFVRIGTSFFK